MIIIYTVKHERKYIRELADVIADSIYQTNIMKCKFLLYKYDTSIVIASGIAIVDKIYDSVKITSGEINNEIFNNSNTDYYTCILYNFDTDLLRDDFIDKNLQVTISRCKISSNFAIYMNSDKTYWDCEIIPLADYDTGEMINLTID